MRSRVVVGIALAFVAIGATMVVRDHRRGYGSTRGATLTRFTLHSRDVGRDLHELLVTPRRHGRTLLVLLHGRGSTPSSFLSQQFFDGLAALGRRAPTVLLLDGGDHSYWHDRADGRWGSMVYGEALPAGLRRTHARRIAIGGLSMGGFGALRLGVTPLFCAVGAHSPALWRRAGETAPGAFDDAADFARNDLFAHRERYRAPVWIDVGADDPFHDADVGYAHRIHARLHVWPGGHESSYWRAHMRSYLRFYADACD
jgi:enterochelin esterase-like enzyme